MTSRTTRTLLALALAGVLSACGGGDGDSDTAGGVDANASKRHLYELAQRADVPGRSKMSKDELVEALDKANRRATAKARQD